IINEQQPDYVYWHANYPDVLMFYAFDTKLNPKIFQQETEYFERESSGFQHVASLQGRFFQSKQSLPSIVCQPQATASGKILVVEQDGTLIKQIEELVQRWQNLPADDPRREEPILAWPIKTINEAMTLGYIVDAEWYDKAWCQPQANDKQK
ncbi:hypothetical protein IJI99_03465, partial [bacterium]|nr:hypothetical protein [bacterium]